MARQSDASSTVDKADDLGCAEGRAGMKGGGKGKARDGMTAPGTSQQSETGEMDWEADGAYDHRSHGTEVGRCEQIHAAGGAGSIAKLPRPPPAADDADAPVRDGEFYIDSADCVIRVDNTLFRVSGACFSPTRRTSLRSSSPPCAPHSSLVDYVRAC